MITVSQVVLPRRGCILTRAAGKPLQTTRETTQEQNEEVFMEFVRRLWCEQQGQDIAEYAVMLAVILVIVVGTVRLIGSNANNVFSNVASSIQ